MNLIRCHIENFGKLSDFTWDFCSDLNQLCRENGWGKSTLAEFIKVMFYGFDNEGKRDELENERKHYKPWQGGVYGGNIAFSAGGKKYLAERTFGNKASEDVFVLRSLDTNMECNDFSEKLGEEIFKIDSKSFARTIYISQNDCESAVTDSIHAKMGNLVDATDDINNYDSVTAGFKKKLNEMTPTRKTGSLYKLKEEIAEKTNRLRAERDIEESARKIYDLRLIQKEKYNELSGELGALSDRQKKLGEYMDKAANKQEYERILREEDERKALFEEEAEYFAGDVPEEEELEQCIDKSIALNSALSSVENYQLSPEEAAALSGYSERFSEEVPDSEEIEEIYGIAAKLKELETWQQRNNMTDEELSAYDEYKSFFKNENDNVNNINDATISQYIRDWNVYQEKKSQLNARQNYAYTLQHIAAQKEESIKEAVVKKKKTAVAVTIAAGILCVVSVTVAILFNQYSAAAAPAAAMTALLCLCSIMYCIVLNSIEKNKLKTDSNQQVNIRIQDEIQEDERIMEEIKSSVTNFFEGLGITYNEATVEEKLYDLKIKYADYKKLSAKAEDVKRLDKSAEIAECTGIIQEFMQKYIQDDTSGDTLEYMAGKENVEACIRRLENSIKEYKQLEEKNAKFKEAKNKADSLKADIDSFLEKYGFDKESVSDSLMTIKDRRQSYIHSRNEYGRSSLARNSFERENDVEQLKLLQCPEDGVTLEELSEKAEEIRSAMEQCHKNILEYTGQLEELDEKLDELAELAESLEADRERYDESRKNYELISETMELMEQAKISFTAKYVAPVKNAFEKYYCLISEDDGRKYHIDADSNVTIYEAGMQREGRFLSRGLKDLTGICMRMALIQAMYEDEKPFIIFDDPFVNLDEERTDGGIKFLREIEKEYQVIYLTCHSARSV